jgi:hypothetical protein
MSGLEALQFETSSSEETAGWLEPRMQRRMSLQMNEGGRQLNQTLIKLARWRAPLLKPWLFQDVVSLEIAAVVEAIQKSTDRGIGLRISEELGKGGVWQIHIGEDETQPSKIEPNRMPGKGRSRIRHAEGQASRQRLAATVRGVDEEHGVAREQTGLSAVQSPVWNGEAGKFAPLTRLPFGFAEQP